MAREHPHGAAAYRTRLLETPRIVAAGVEHGTGECRELLAWSSVIAAVAAEVGEPQGVRTIVFDLIAETASGRTAWRMDAEPGEAATVVARAIAAGCGDRARTSIQSLATDGIPALWFPDLASFAEATAGEVA